MYDFLPNSHDLGEYAYHTTCYLAFPSIPDGSGVLGGGKDAAKYQLFEDGVTHAAFRETLDTSWLTISEKQRFRFARAMKRLGLKPRYHLSELEPHVVHPMKDEDLACICSCHDMDCPGACPDIHSWDRPSCLEQTLKSKSKGTNLDIPSCSTHS